MEKWCENGQEKRIESRTTAVKFKGQVIVSTYMPVDRGNNREEIETVREEIGVLSRWAGEQDLLMIGGDWNAHIGGNERSEGCGKYGVRASNHQGREMLSWLIEIGMISGSCL